VPARPKKNLQWLWWTLVVLGVGALGWAAFALLQPKAPATTPTEDVTAGMSSFTVGLSLASVFESRWRAERDLITQEIERLGGTVISNTADTDAALQELQIRNLILQGVDALIVVPQDSEKAAKFVEIAHDAGVPVIAYDRLISGAAVDYYISFDPIETGEKEALGVLAKVNKGKFAYIGGCACDNNGRKVREGGFKALQPLIDSGDIELVLDQMIESWNAAEAYRLIDEYLTDGGVLDAVVVANDGMAGGVIQALTEHGLAGKIPVSGQDAELAAVRRILEGTQTMTVYKPYKDLALEASKMAADAALGNEVYTDQTVNNGTHDVPARILNVIHVDTANIDETVIADGIYTAAEVYGNN
jgi:D-xylose transport system substrate-binding protein